MDFIRQLNVKEHYKTDHSGIKAAELSKHFYYATRCWQITGMRQQLERLQL